MCTHNLRDLRKNLGKIIREVAYEGKEAKISDSGTVIAAIVRIGDFNQWKSLKGEEKDVRPE